MDYDFHQLNDKEFEVLVCDLLEKKYNTTIERFKSGKDGGIDGRFFIGGKTIIIQAKHYIKTDYKSMIYKLKDEELAKVKKLNPKRYIFVTSMALSPANKNEIKNIFGDFIRNTADILGRDEVNNLLSRNTDIEEKYFKLWITSTNTLKRLLNSAIKGRSEYEIKAIIKKGNKYVETENHIKALDILAKNHVLIISGEPGVGKTTLAENLCLYYTSKDFEFICIEEDLSEAEDIYEIGKKQIFYFDDFLGSNYFEALENKKDSHIIKFIERVKSDPTKAFILTSRTNILNSGIHHSTTFATNKINKNEFLLTIESLSKMSKARILYNHIFFSNLGDHFIDEIYIDKRYKKIIGHKNFNPRLIEFITDLDRVDNLAPGEYRNYIENMLNNPKEIRSNSFKVQADDYIRSLVYLTVFNGGKIKEDELKKSFHRFQKLRKLTNTSHTEKDFNSIMKLTIKFFLNRSIHNNEVSYELFNPSLADFVLHEYRDDIDKLENIYKSLETLPSLLHLRSLRTGKIITGELNGFLIEKIFMDAIENKTNYDYLIYIGYQFNSYHAKDKFVTQLLKKIIKQPRPVKLLSELLNLITSYSNVLDISQISLGALSNYYSDRSLSYHELQEIFYFIALNNIDINDDDFFEDIKEHAVNCLKDKAEEILRDTDFAKYQRNNRDGCIELDEDKIYNELYELTTENADDITHNTIDLEIDPNTILSDIGIDDAIKDYYSSQNYNLEDIKKYDNILDDANDIDELFSRN